MSKGLERSTNVLLGSGQMAPTRLSGAARKRTIEYDQFKGKFPSLIGKRVVAAVPLFGQSRRDRARRLIETQKADMKATEVYVKHPTVNAAKRHAARERRLVAAGLIIATGAVYGAVKAAENDVPTNIVAAYSSFTGGDTGTTTGGENTSGGGTEFEVGQGGAGAGGDEAAAETFVSGKGKNKISCIGELATVKVKKNQPPLTAMTEAGGGIQFDRLKPAVAQQFYDDVIANQEAWGSTADPSKQFVFQPHCEVPAGAYIPN